MDTPFLGEVKMVAFSFAPTGWALCNGQLLSTAEYSALFNLLGTMYGGDGTTNFALPNLQGSVPLHIGAGYTQGRVGGSANVTLAGNQIGHGHTVIAATAAASNTAAGNFPAPAGSNIIYGSGTPDTTMNSAAIAQAGGGQPHSNLQPYLVVNFVIALTGIYPQAN